MPIFLLKIKADLENIDEIICRPDNLWQFNIASSTDPSDTRDGITVSEMDAIELNGSKGEANYVMMMDFCLSMS